MQCDLSGLVSISLQSKLADCDSTLDPEEWLLVAAEPIALPGANPNRSMLDAINPDRATVLVGEDGLDLGLFKSARVRGLLRKRQTCPMVSLSEMQAETFRHAP